MVKVITQETFDSAVKENIEEFSMSSEEAVADAVKQFETQGVDLSNIIKDLAISSKEDANLIPDSLKTVEDYLEQKSNDKEKILIALENLKAECDKDMPHRLMAATNGAYDIILKAMVACDAEKDIIEQSLITMIALMTGQPDLLTPSGIELMIKYFKQPKDHDIQLLVLKWIKECCIKHENNRQQIFGAAILDYLKPILVHGHTLLLKDVCAVLRALVLDDDVRVEFGKAHEHARIIASDTLNSITELLTKHKDDETLVIDLLLTLSTLIVRNEFCQKVEDAGGLDFILEALKDFNSSEKVTRQALKLLKVLGGNDQCKINIIQKGGAERIAQSMSTHMKSAQTLVIGLNCIAALTLRSPDNSKVIFETGLPEIMVESMRLHPDHLNLHKSASRAIRNMVSRSRYQNEKFLSLGVEAILQEDLTKFKESEYEIKAALRDLECQVNFKEEWTGKGGKLTTQNITK